MRVAIHHLINCDTFDFYPETTLATKRGTHQERLHLQKKTMLWNYTDKNATSSELKHLPGNEPCIFLFPGYLQTKQPDGGGFESF